MRYAAIHPSPIEGRHRQLVCADAMMSLFNYEEPILCRSRYFSILIETGEEKIPVCPIESSEISRSSNSRYFSTIYEKKSFTNNHYIFFL